MITNIKTKFQSIKIKLFLTLCATVAVIIAFLILMNSMVLEKYYIYKKQMVLINAYKIINAYYNGTLKSNDFNIDLEKIAFTNDFDILIKTSNSIYTTSKDFIESLTDAEYNRKKGIDENLLFNDENIEIKRTLDKHTELSFILLTSTLDNGYELYIRVAIAPIEESVKIANKFLMLIGFIAIIASGMVVLIISKKFTHPIEELNQITSKISKLDFSHKYNEREEDDEINNLRKKHKYNV